jgi:methylenetetrahydrofolate dehydrogenase (NADP+) / methenyltetrahydrofolate cyclohydrolase
MDEKGRRFMIIDGRTIANQIQQEIKLSLMHLSGRKPCLAVIIIGDNPASHIYVTKKTKACEEVGIDSHKHILPHHATEHELTTLILTLNQDPTVDGILIQLPLPAHLNPLKMIAQLDPAKDVDGLHPLNVGKLLIGDSNTFVPCTPLGIHTLLKRMNIEISGKHVLIIGRSNIVGKPLAALLIQNTLDCNATVTIAHSKTSNLKHLCLTADILIAAIGQPKFVTQDMVKPGAVVIDVGINRIPMPESAKGYQVVGDVDFNNVKEKCSFISPVPYGVGPMTIAMLLSNTLRSWRKTTQGVL